MSMSDRDGCLYYGKLSSGATRPRMSDSSLHYGSRILSVLAYTRPPARRSRLKAHGTLFLGKDFHDADSVCREQIFKRS